jgi:hypothetical protein
LSRHWVQPWAWESGGSRRGESATRSEAMGRRREDLRVMGRVSVSQTQVKVVGGFAVKGKAEPFVKGSSARIGFKHGEDDATFLIASVGDQLSADG